MPNVLPPAGRKLVKGLVAVIVLALVWWFGLRTDPKVAALNDAIETQGSQALLGYPYEFRVVRLEGGMATMSTPRSPAMPVVRMIGAIDPWLAGKGPDNPDFVTAEKHLADVQAEARAIVLKQPGVTQVKWELDEGWLISHGIQMNVSSPY